MIRSAHASLAEFYQAHYAPTQLVGAAYETRREYERIVRRWSEVTGDPPLAEITNATVASFYEALLEFPNKSGGTLSPNTVRKHARHLQPILELAGPPSHHRRDGLGLIDPVPWARPPRGVEDVLPAASAAEVGAMYEHADQALYPWPERSGVAVGDWWRAALVLAWCTGLRVGTMLAITDSNVRWADREICVRGTASKTRRAQVVPVPDVVVRHLLPLRRAEGPLLAFPHRSVRLYHEFHRLRQLAGLPEQRGQAWHAIRRRFATSLAKRSASAAQIALGHATFKTTVRSYLQADEIIREAIDDLELPAAFLAASRSKAL